VKLAAFRQGDIGEGEAGAHGRGGKVLSVFFWRQAHGGGSSWQRVSPSL
jgi:hypothetical protein